MGQTISQAVEEAKKQSDENAAKAREVLNMLQQIGKDKLTIFEKEVKENIDKEIPIDKIIEANYMIRCFASQTPDDLKKGIEDVAKSFASGDWVSGLVGTISLGIDAVLSGFQGSTSEKRLQTVTLGPLGGITKIDYYFYAYQISTKGLVGNSESLLVCAYTVSSVKPSEIDYDTVKVLAEKCLLSSVPKLSIEEMKKTLEEFKIQFDKEKQK